MITLTAHQRDQYTATGRRLAARLVAVNPTATAVDVYETWQATAPPEDTTNDQIVLAVAAGIRTGLDDNR